MTPDLSAPYGRDLFLDIVANLVPGVSNDIRRVDDVGPNFASVTSLGASPELDLQLFEVEIRGSLDKRIAIASDAFRLMRQTAAYRSLVAFHSKERAQWRLSLLSAKPTIENGHVVTRLSNPRRFSYLLGPSSKLTTPSKQLLSKGAVSDFADLAKRFAVEVVNHEFYKEIAALYDELVGTEDTRGELTYPGTSESAQEFAVRLIGRIIFCWFLREKTSQSGTALVPLEVLSRDAAGESNYYHRTLAPLFFEVLNKHPRGREPRFQALPYASIPYLNGGLFSPDADDYYKFDRVEQVASQSDVHVPDVWIRRLFELLELYNFTVDENTSFDVDLSIDPEMLGRIFENLLARINPETGETVRRGTGSYYTPREIVEYMVDECLVAYLATTTSISTEQIADLVRYDHGDASGDILNPSERAEVLHALGLAKILDPACGSGAFPIGVLQKIVFILQRIDPDAKSWLKKQLVGASPELRHHLEEEFRNKNFDYLRKLGVIRESIYGVDIQPIATEISRLRCFLTLVVEQSVEDDAPNRGIEPLPNLDFKFVTANSLIHLEDGSVSGNADQTGLFEDTTGITELKELRSEYFGSHNSEREALKLRFAQSQNEMLQRMIAQHSHGFAELTKRISTWSPFSHHATNWFDPEWMFGISDGFDIVIGNPPYYKENDDKRRFDGLRGLECYQGKMDVWYLFGALGIDLLKPSGTLSFIATNNWTTNAGAAKFRKKLLRESRLTQLIDFNNYMVFESSAIQTMVMLVQKVKESVYTFDHRRLKASRPTRQDMIDILLRSESPRVTYSHPTINVAERVNSLLTFSEGTTEQLLAKIESAGKFRIGRKEIGQGIVCPQDYLNKKSAQTLGGGHRVGEGVFVLRQREVDDLKLSSSEQSLLRPYYTTKQIKRYAASDANDEWIIYTDSKYKDPQSLDRYPRLRKHLDEFARVITSSNRPYGLHRSRDEHLFKGEKILALRKSAGQPMFSLVNFDSYVSQSFNVVKTQRLDLKFLCGVLNSKLIAFWLRNRGKMQGDNYQIDREPIEAIPIATGDIDTQLKIATNVADLYARNGSAEKCEAEIDALVYRLYGLDGPEIDLIEQSNLAGRPDEA